MAVPPQRPAGSLLKFFGLTFAFSWIPFAVAVALSGRLTPATPAVGVLRALVLIGTFAPSIAALALSAQADGAAGPLELFRHVFEWRVPARWWVFAAGYLASVKVAVALVHRVALGAWPKFGDTPWYVMVAAVAFSTPVQAGEEIGWRGYALPRLAKRLGMARASLLLGVIWATWHLPGFFVAGTDNFGQSFPVFVLGVTALSVAMAWLYSYARGSLLLPMMMHAAINNTRDIVPSAVSGAANAFSTSASPVAWLTVAVLWIAAGYFLVQMSREVL